MNVHVHVLFEHLLSVLLGRDLGVEYPGPVVILLVICVSNQHIKPEASTADCWVGGQSLRCCPDLCSSFVGVQDGELGYGATLRVTSMVCSFEVVVQVLCPCTGMAEPL